MKKMRFINSLVNIKIDLRLSKKRSDPGSSVRDLFGMVSSRDLNSKAKANRDLHLGYKKVTWKKLDHPCSWCPPPQLTVHQSKIPSQSTWRS